jgi:hypothetical protein
MNAASKGMSALVVLGVLLATILFWTTAMGLDADSSHALARHTDFQIPAALPAPAPQHESVLRTHHVAAETIAHNAQPVAIPAPAHSK